MIPKISRQGLLFNLHFLALANAFQLCRRCSNRKLSCFRECPSRRRPLVPSFGSFAPANVSNSPQPFNVCGVKFRSRHGPIRLFQSMIVCPGAVWGGIEAHLLLIKCPLHERVSFLVGRGRCGQCIGDIDFSSRVPILCIPPIEAIRR